jgi:hypothetical protein
MYRTTPEMNVLLIEMGLAPRITRIGSMRPDGKGRHVMVNAGFVFFLIYMLLLESF